MSDYTILYPWSHWPVTDTIETHATVIKTNYTFIESN